MKNDIRVHIALLTASVFHAINYTAVKRITPEYLSPESLIFLRMGAAAVLFWATYSLIKKEKIQSNKDYLRFLVVAFFGTAFNVVLFFKGLSITTQTKAAFTMTITPIFVLIISVIWLSERLSKIKVAGIVLAAVGYALMIGGKRLSFESDTLPGDIMILVNALSYGTYLILVKPLMEKYHPVTVFRWVFLMGSTMIFIYAFPNIITDNWEALPGKVWGIAVFIVLCATYGTYLLNAWSLRYATATVVSIYIYLQPVLASLLAIAIGDDEFTVYKVIYGVIILTGVIMVSRKSVSPNKP